MLDFIKLQTIIINQLYFETCHKSFVFIVKNIECYQCFKKYYSYYLQFNLQAGIFITQFI
ncbi:unnamed protein product [Paramecium octaurelia]|uniref:Uncharacterized protein n=1 Tax=Paramecium octaurelia TaxID=43137 RepID=A0A8S1XF45_PAROT|nr:unnamed protein product [Paramecium octaurelia]